MYALIKDSGLNINPPCNVIWSDNVTKWSIKYKYLFEIVESDRPNHLEEYEDEIK